MPVPADDDVIVHLDAKRLGHLDDLFGHLDVGARRRARRYARSFFVIE